MSRAGRLQRKTCAVRGVCLNGENCIYRIDSHTNAIPGVLVIRRRFPLPTGLADFDDSATLQTRKKFLPERSLVLLAIG
jgi:hypothetical protein